MLMVWAITGLEASAYSSVELAQKIGDVIVDHMGMGVTRYVWGVNRENPWYYSILTNSHITNHNQES